MISSFCRALQLWYSAARSNLVERPALNRAPAGLSAATPLQDCPASQPSYMSTRDRGSGQRAADATVKRDSPDHPLPTSPEELVHLCYGCVILRAQALIS